MLSPKAAFAMEEVSVADALAASESIGEDDEWDPDSEIWIP